MRLSITSTPSHTGHRRTAPLAGVTLTDDLKPVLHTRDGEDYECDVFYPMLGQSARSQLAAALGAETAECDTLLVDDHCRTSIPGLYAAGDVVRGLNQIVVAMGHAAVAATHIHNRCELPTEDEPDEARKSRTG